MRTDPAKKFPLVPSPEGVQHPGGNKRGPKNELGPPRKYPFDQLDVGQSFLAPVKLRHTLASLAVYHGRRMGKLFAVITLEYDKTQVAVCRTQ